MAFKRPESVLVIIYSKDAQVLMLERVQPHGFWQSVTGSLHEGESVSEAALRELEEETGIIAMPTITMLEHNYEIIPAWRDRYAPEVTHNHETVFVLQLDACCEVRLNPHEHRRYVWLSREQAAAKASSWTNRDAILSLVPEND